MTSIVLLDDVKTWPSGFRALVEATAAESDEEVWLSAASECLAQHSLMHHRVRVYHCTRLTPREIADVTSGGLKPLSVEFTQERIRSAVLDGHLTEDEGRIYDQTKLPREENRAGRVWLFTDPSCLTDAHRIGNLVDVWGGEGINMMLSSGSPLFKRLERVGIPTVIIAAIDLDRHCEYASPGLLTAAVRHFRGERGGTEIMSRSTVEPEYIESIEHPGGHFWRQHVWTPTSGFVGDGA